MIEIMTYDNMNVLKRRVGVFEQADKLLGTISASDLENEFYCDWSILNHKYGTNGRIKEEDLKRIMMNRKINIMHLDRNVFSEINSIIKSGNPAKHEAAHSFLIWLGLNRFFKVSPYNAIHEYVYLFGKHDAGDKEFFLFDKLMSEEFLDDLIKARFYDGYSFEPRPFKEAEELRVADFSSENMDYKLLYAMMLHLVYILRTESNEMLRFEKMMTWLFEAEILSGYALVYSAMLLSSIKGITPPHHYLDDSRVINGCRNQAMDLVNLHFLEENRYPGGFEPFLVSKDKCLIKIFGIWNKIKEKDTVEDIADNIFDESHNKHEFASAFIELYKLKKTTTYDSRNVLGKANEWVRIEEELIKSIL